MERTFARAMFGSGPGLEKFGCLKARSQMASVYPMSKSPDKRNSL